MNTLAPRALDLLRAALPTVRGDVAAQIAAFLGVDAASGVRVHVLPALDLTTLREAEARGWCWRLGPSACSHEPFYVAHVWRKFPASHASRVTPCTGVTLTACVEAMLTAIERAEAAEAANATSGPGDRASGDDEPPPTTRG